MITLSPTSSIALFLECPRCFWLDKVKGIARPRGIFPSLPGGMDRVLKEHFDGHRAKKTMPPELDGFSGSLYGDIQRLDIWRDQFQGLQFHDPCGITLKGAIDDLFVTTEGLYAPIDFKTRGSPIKENTHEFNRNQMDIYSLLLEKNGLKPAGFAILLYYSPRKVNASHNIEFHAEPVKIHTSTENALKVFRGACEVLKGGEPAPGKNCGFCGWGGW